MNYLYAVLFSDGLVKVGRSKSPEKRIEDHEIRLSCAGISKVDSQIIPLNGNSSLCELRLIEWCRSKADECYLREWFRGLVFDEVCSTALFISKNSHHVPQSNDDLDGNIQDFIELAGGRKKLAEMLGLAPISTYRWKTLPQKHEDRLRVAKPSWFRKPKEKTQ
jgi:hypothetical protein